MNRLPVVAIVAVTCLMLVTTAANAHNNGTGYDHSLLSGFSHPYGGLDHVLVMLAVGWVAAGHGPRARWLIPSLFIGAMVVGGLAGASGYDIPLMELAIASSVITMGVVVGLDKTSPIAVAIAMIAAVGALHGYAHGAEMPPAASGSIYFVGFTVATSTLIWIGIGIKGAIVHSTAGGSPRLASLGGGLIALAGFVGLFGAV
jgi:urease accessory protein